MERPSLLLLTLLLTLCVSAQRDQRVHLFSCSEELGTAAEKPLVERVLDLDPNGRISIDGAKLKVAISRSVGSAELLARLNHAGVGSFSVLPGSQKSDTDHGPTDLPVFHDTGDPEADRAAYDAAKAAWRAAHPEVPQDLNQVH